MNNYKLRFFRNDRPADHQAVVHLEKLCVQGTDVRFVIGTSPPRHEKFTERHILFAECRKTGETVASIAANIRTVLFKSPDQFEKVSWLFNLRVDPRHRRSGLAIWLVNEMEQFLVAKGVSLVYAGVFKDNVPSWRLFIERLQYQNVLEPPQPTCGINVKHMSRLIDRSKSNRKSNFTFAKLENQESERFLRQHLGSTFMFPNERYPVDCYVYEATLEDSGESLAVAVTKVCNEWTFVNASLLLIFKTFLLTFLSWLWPHRFERPLPLGKPVRLRQAFPYIVRINEPNNFEPLLDALFSGIVDDLKSDTDALRIHYAPCFSGLDHLQSNALLSSRFISNYLFKKEAINRAVKIIGENNQNRAKSMINYISQRQFWFVDAKEI